MRLPEAIFLATLSTAFLPVPEEAALLAAGYAARRGDVSLAGALAPALLAVVAGDVTAYLVGRLLLARLLRTRIGRRIVPDRWRLWGEAVVARSALRAVVVARFLVGLRGFVYFAVGHARYPFVRFLAVDVVAGALEVALLVGVGFAAGELRASVGAAIDACVAVLLAGTFFGPAIARRLARPRAPSRSAAP
ncbi:MAG TPA: VTT domain-containing protein [Polyangiaceae bacterium]